MFRKVLVERGQGVKVFQVGDPRKMRLVIIIIPRHVHVGGGGSGQKEVPDVRSLVPTVLIPVDGFSCFVGLVSEIYVSLR